MKKTLSIALALVLCLGLLAACGEAQSDPTDAPETDSTASEAPSSEPIELTGIVNTDGSTSMNDVMLALIEGFKSVQPGVTVNYNGSGSGSGISGVLAGSCDLGLSSRALTDDEKAEGAVENVIAKDGVAVVVNPANPVTELTTEQIAKIFTGEITNWNQVGGSDQEIVVINRQAGSGTRAVFEAAVLGDQESATFQEQDSSGTVAKMVSETPGAISYLAFSYFDDQTKALSVDGVAPETANVEDNSWTIWAYEHMYTALESDAATAAFIEYMMSDEVQGSLVEENGYIPVSGMKVEKDAEGNVTEI